MYRLILRFLLASFSFLTVFSPSNADDFANSGQYEPVSIDVGPNDKILFSSRSGSIYTFENGSAVERIPHDKSIVFADPSWAEMRTDVLYSGFESKQLQGSIRGFDLSKNLTEVYFSEKGRQCRFPQMVSSDEIVFASASTQRDYAFGGKIWTNWDIWSLKMSNFLVHKITNESFSEIDSISIDRENQIVMFTGRSREERDKSNLFILNLNEEQLLPKRIATGVGKANSNSSNAWNVCYDQSNQAMIFVSDRNREYWYELFSLKIGGNVKQLRILPNQKFFQSPRVSDDGSTLYFLSEDDFDDRNRPLLGLWKYAFLKFPKFGRQ